MKDLCADSKKHFKKSIIKRQAAQLKVAQAEKEIQIATEHMERYLAH